MKKKIILSLFIIIFISKIAYSVIDSNIIDPNSIIWKIGCEDETCEEFLNCTIPYTDFEHSISYSVFNDWNIGCDQQTTPGITWGNFPARLYPYYINPNNPGTPKEIKINYTYLEKYTSVELYIVARVSYEDIIQHLEVYKGSDVYDGSLLGRVRVCDRYYSYFKLPLGTIKKGLCDENIIILRNITDPNSINMSISVPVRFDTLYLVDYDRDKDGVDDYDEGDDDYDMDGVKDYLDQDTVSILFKSDNSEYSESINLDIQELEGVRPYFQNVQLKDPNILEGTIRGCDECCYPYGFLNFTISQVPSGTNIELKINFEDTLYTPLNFYILHNSYKWINVPFELIDENTAKIIIQDGGQGDGDGLVDGSINTILTLAYPISFGIEIDKGKCFVRLL